MAINPIYFNTFSGLYSETVLLPRSFARELGIATVADELANVCTPSFTAQICVVPNVPCDVAG